MQQDSQNDEQKLVFSTQNSQLEVDKDSSQNNNQNNENIAENNTNTNNNILKDNSVTNLLNLNNAKTMLNTPGLFPFDLSQWEDNPELNFMLDAQNQAVGSPSILSNAMSPAFTNLQNINMNQKKNMNQIGQLELTPNYSEQLQHYQNMLIETQAMLTMKQMQHKGQNDNIQSEKNIQQFIQQQSQQQQSQHFSPALLNDISLANFSNYNPQQQQLFQQQLNQLNQAELLGTPQIKSQTNLQNLTANPLMLQSLLTNPLLSQNIIQPQNLNLLNGNLANAQNSVAGFSSTSAKAGNKSDKKTEPPQPRTKVRPCDHCRRRKTKCVMIQDLQSCKLCQQKGLKCVFNEASLKRSNSANESDSNKRMKFEDPTIEPPPNVLLRDTPPIKDYSAMQGHSLLKKTLSLQFPRSSFYIGPTSIYDTLLLEKVSLDKIDQFQINKSNSIRKVADSVQFILRDDYTEHLYEQSERDSDTVEKYVAPHGQTLIDLYFKTVHPSFPVIHKKIFLEKYARTHREFGAPLLAAVYLLAIQWWDFEPKLANVEKPNVISLYRFALRTFSDIIQRPKLSAVQAGLLLLQCQNICDQHEKGKSVENENLKFEFSSNQNNWLICTQVVGLAEELGLGLDCTTWRLPKWERGLRRRLAWAVYLQDKWSSLVESRPSHIIDNVNWIVKPLSDEDFPERVSNTNDSNDNDNIDSIANVDIEMGRECFKQSVLLSQIVSEIQSTIYSPKTMLEINDIETVLKAAKPAQLKLRQWYHSLPKQLQMKESYDKRFHANGNLHLSYFAAEITLHRRIISILHNQLKGQKDEGTPLDSNKQDFHNNKSTPPTPQLVTVCRNAARMRLTASISYVKELNKEHIHSLWHSSAPKNFALIGIFAALLCVTSITHEEATIYCEHLHEYRWVLNSLAEEFKIARHALILLDGVVKNITGLYVDFDNVSMGGTTVESVNQITSIPTPTSFGQPNMGTTSTNMNPLLRKTQTYNYDLSNGVSPKNTTSSVNSRRRPTSNIGTPNHSPRSNSPLQNMNKPGTTPATPILVSQSVASTPRQSQQSTTKVSSPSKSEKN